MKIATWNINGVRARIENLVSWLEKVQPDIVCLQELKTVDETFPYLIIQSLGYHVEAFGQQGFNGVAILSKQKPEEVMRGLPGDDEDVQSRFIEAVFSIDGGVVRVASIYLPNGNPVDNPVKYPYKLSWLERLENHARARLLLEEPLILAGDYNVIPQPYDCFDAKVWANDALFLPQTRAAFRRLENLGLTDAYRAVSDLAPAYTFWDYQAGAWPKNMGIRIDHLLLSAEATTRLISVDIQKHTRAWEKPSDHVPVVGEFAF